MAFLHLLQSLSHFVSSHSSVSWLKVISGSGANVRARSTRVNFLSVANIKNLTTQFTVTNAHFYRHSYLDYSSSGEYQQIYGGKVSSMMLFRKVSWKSFVKEVAHSIFILFQRFMRDAEHKYSQKTLCVAFYVYHIELDMSIFISKLVYWKRNIVLLIYKLYQFSSRIFKRKLSSKLTGRKIKLIYFAYVSFSLERHKRGMHFMDLVYNSTTNKSYKNTFHTKRKPQDIHFSEPKEQIKDSHLL